jgi:endonuclease/exonuclease/phosphatase family metal-dependent hydrolase
VSTVRFVVCTYNIWGLYHWEERARVLAAFLRLHRPDVLGLQELHPGSRDVIDEVLSGHDRVHGPDDEGWSVGNIYVARELFEILEHGAEEIGMDGENRRLLWVRLRVEGDGRELVVASGHYTWPGHPEEARTGVSPRPEQARRTLEVLDRVAGPGEPLLFMGDLNDALHPLRILREGGLEDCFSALRRLPPPTRPTVPRYGDEVPQVNDWILHRGPLRPMACDVADFFGDTTPPSDHKPVLAAYALGR